MNFHTYPAKKHDTPALESTAAVALAARKAAGFYYRVLYWNADGVADVVDVAGTKKTVTAVAGGVYPLENCGVVTGGNTTLVQGGFSVLYD